VDIHFVLPFAFTPQAAPRPPKEPEGTPGHFYRLRLAHFHVPTAVKRGLYTVHETLILKRVGRLTPCQTNKSS
jgi:hypothetical protein